MAETSCFRQAIPLSRQFRSGFNGSEIQRLGRLRMKALLNAHSTVLYFLSGDTPPLAVSLLECCSVCVEDGLPKSASVLP